MTSQPIVTVAITTYNHAAFIEQTLNSVVSQDYDNLRIVVSDDASSDGTADIIRDFERRYPGRVIGQYHHQNLGVNGNSLSLSPLIVGEYMCWLGGDDLFLPGKISRQVELLEAEPDAVMCYHDMDVFDSATGVTLYRYNDPKAGQRPFSGDIVAPLIIRRCFVGGNAYMVRRKAVEGLKLRPEVGRVSDWVYIVEAAARGKVIYLDLPLVKYRRHGQNLSNIVDMSDELSAYQFFESEFPERRREIMDGQIRLTVSYILRYTLSGRFTLASQCLCSLGIWASRRIGTIGVAISALIDISGQRLNRLQIKAAQALLRQHNQRQ